MAKEWFYTHTAESAWLHAATELKITDEDRASLKAFTEVNTRDGKSYIDMNHGYIENVGT